MAQNERILAGVLEIFRHNPQKQFRVDQIERWQDVIDSAILQN